MVVGGGSTSTGIIAGGPPSIVGTSSTEIVGGGVSSIGMVGGGPPVAVGGAAVTGQ